MLEFFNPPAPKPRLAADKIDGEYRRMRLKVFLGAFFGYASYYSMTAGDIPFSMFYLVFMAMMTLLGNLITDVLYAVVDPRVRVS